MLILNNEHAWDVDQLLPAYPGADCIASDAKNPLLRPSKVERIIGQ